MTRKIELQEMIQEVSQLQHNQEKGENLIFSPVIGAAAQAEIFKECESLHGSGEGDPRALMNELAKEAQHQTDLMYVSNVVTTVTRIWKPGFGYHIFSKY